MLKSLEKRIRFYKGGIYVSLGSLCGLIISLISIHNLIRNNLISLILFVGICINIIVLKYLIYKETYIKNIYKKEQKKMYIRPSLLEQGM